jgi:uncharacterized membrane protein
LFPEELGEDKSTEKSHDLALLKDGFPYKAFITSPKSGYLQDLDDKVIIKTAAKKNLLILLNNRPGDYLVEDLQIGEVYGKEVIEKKEIHHIRNALIIGKVRTPQRDAEFSIHQMVEVGVRALSPGINDPYTAIACIENLNSSLCYLANVKFPSKYRYDKENNLRVVADTLTFEGMLNAAFNQIRQYGKGSPAVMIRLMEALATIQQFARDAEQKQAIQKQVEIVMRAARSSFDEENDLMDLERRRKFIFYPKENK